MVKTAHAAAIAAPNRRIPDFLMRSPRVSALRPFSCLPAYLGQSISRGAARRLEPSQTGAMPAAFPLGNRHICNQQPPKRPRPLAGRYAEKKWRDIYYASARALSAMLFRNRSRAPSQQICNYQQWPRQLRSERLFLLEVGADACAADEQHAEPAVLSVCEPRAIRRCSEIRGPTESARAGRDRQIHHFPTKSYQWVLEADIDQRVLALGSPSARPGF